MDGQSISRPERSRQFPDRVIVAILAILMPLDALADETSRCADLKVLVEQASTKSVLLDAGASLAATLNAEHCGTALTQSGSRELHCRWSFAYRAAEAEATQDRLASDIRNCLNAAKVAPEQGVNHPDTYDQQLFRTEDAELSLSQKDKAALQRTFVFLRTAARTK